MIKVLFICHGNICRSPMAEFVFQDIVKEQGLSAHFKIASAATSSEELGNPVHYGTRRKLAEQGISCEGKRAVRLQSSDYADYDYLIAMDDYNLSNMHHMLGTDPLHKMYLLLDFSQHPRAIADPWYTGDFDQTYADILEGCNGLLAYLKQKFPELQS